MEAQVLLLTAQDGNRSAAIAAYSLLIQEPIFSIIQQKVSQISKDRPDWDVNDPSWAINYADEIYNQLSQIQ